MNTNEAAPQVMTIPTLIPGRSTVCQKPMKSQSKSESHESHLPKSHRWVDLASPLNLEFIENPKSRPILDNLKLSPLHYSEEQGLQRLLEDLDEYAKLFKFERGSSVFEYEILEKLYS